MKIEDNPLLTYTRVRRHLARWVNAVRTSRARLHLAEGPMGDSTFWFHPGEHEFGDFTISYGGAGGGLEELEFYNAQCGIAIELKIGHENIWRDHGPESKVQMVYIRLWAGKPFEKKKPDYTQPILVGGQLCEVIYLIGPTGVERRLRVNGLPIDSLQLEGSKVHICGSAIQGFLSFVHEVVEKGKPFKEFMSDPLVQRIWAHSSSARRIGWRDHEDKVFA